MIKEIPADFSQNRKSKHHATRIAVQKIRFGYLITAASYVKFAGHCRFLGRSKGVRKLPKTIFIGRRKAVLAGS
jgi:hypothetical protein